MRRRAAITTGGVTTTIDSVLDKSMFVRELRTNAQTQAVYNYATYLVGPRGPEYRRDDTVVGGTVRWYVFDGLGSVLAEVDPNGNVTASRKYDVYGGVRSSTGTSTSKHKFVGSLGHPSDDESGLIYMRARYMDPAIGRFITQDSEKQGTNWYLYTSNSPTNKVDATGHEEDFWDQINEWIEQLSKLDTREMFAAFIDNEVAPWIENRFSPAVNFVILTIFRSAYDPDERQILLQEAQYLLQSANIVKTAEAAVGLGAREVETSDEIESEEAEAGL